MASQSRSSESLKVPGSALRYYDEARHAIYERARTVFREALRNFDPPVSETELAKEQAALDGAIRTAEVVSDHRISGSGSCAEFAVSIRRLEMKIEKLKIERTEACFGIKPAWLAGDTAYGSASNPLVGQRAADHAACSGHRQIAARRWHVLA
jgi:hypothetical protein